MALLLFPTFSPQVILSSPLFSIVSSLYVVVPYHTPNSSDICGTSCLLTMPLSRSRSKGKTRKDTRSSLSSSLRFTFLASCCLLHHSLIIAPWIHSHQVHAEQHPTIPRSNNRYTHYQYRGSSSSTSADGAFLSSPGVETNIFLILRIIIVKRQKYSNPPTFILRGIPPPKSTQTVSYLTSMHDVLGSGSPMPTYAASMGWDVASSKPDMSNYSTYR